METRETKDRIWSLEIRLDRLLVTMDGIIEEQEKTNELLKDILGIMKEEQKWRKITQGN